MFPPKASKSLPYPSLIYKLFIKPILSIHLISLSYPPSPPLHPATPFSPGNTYPRPSQPLERTTHHQQVICTHPPSHPFPIYTPPTPHYHSKELKKKTQNSPNPKYGTYNPPSADLSPALNSGQEWYSTTQTAVVRKVWRAKRRRWRCRRGCWGDSGGQENGVGKFNTIPNP